MDADALFGSGNLHFVNEDYAEAVKHYTCAVTLQEDCSLYRTCRAAAYLKLGKFSEAVQDTEDALRLDPKSHMALHWKGIALFYMGDFAAAKAAFEGSIKANPSAKAPRHLWVRKCDAELSGSSLPLGGIAAEASKAVPAPKEGPGKAPAPVEASSAPAETSASSTAPPDTAAAAAPVGATASAQAGLSISGRKPIKREWYQSSKSVFITIFAKGVAPEDCTVNFEDRSVSLTIKLPNGTDEEYNLETDLFDSVDPSACSIEVSKVKVELTLPKKNEGVHWTSLEKAEALAVPDQPHYPTSSKQKRDWNQVDKDCETELKGDKGGGDEALNKLFREIYDKADDETRRAMNKSFQTSGGTVLSTNWGEVARADYEGKDRPTPPEGQEWRDWRTKKG
mmetsp:Transcript_66082/g.158053  ORF Transcript_66082/g.158053 Transcript_66082/m.158053 type:complete len:395 (+) Transcript_66082:102-1286(+)